MQKQSAISLSHRLRHIRAKATDYGHYDRAGRPGTTVGKGLKGMVSDISLTQLDLCFKPADVQNGGAYRSYGQGGARIEEGSRSANKGEKAIGEAGTDGDNGIKCDSRGRERSKVAY